MMNRKAFSLVLAIIILCSFPACGKNGADPFRETNGGTQSDLPSTAEPSNGYSTEAELIGAFLKSFNSGRCLDAFFDAFDYAGSYAYYINKDALNISFHEAYLAMSDLEYGADYISKQHPDFVRKYDEYYEEHFDEKLVDRMLQDKLEAREAYDRFLREVQDKYEPVDEIGEIADEECIDRSDEICSYSIEMVSNGKDERIWVRLFYIVEDGAYRWIWLNKLVGGWGG